MPARVTLCGLLAALSVKDTLALRLPLALGEKVTPMVQVALMASEVGQVLVCAKSEALVPVMLMLLMLRASVPLLVRVTVWAALVVPTFWLL